MLTIDDFPDGWVRDDQVNENFDGVFLNEDETIVVLTAVQVLEDVSTAEDEFQNSRSGFRDPQDYDLGDEAFWDTRNEELAFTIFRASNAMGQAASLRQSGMETQPDTQRAQNYAETMYDNYW